MLSKVRPEVNPVVNFDIVFEIVSTQTANAEFSKAKYTLFCNYIFKQKQFRCQNLLPGQSS